MTMSSSRPPPSSSSCDARRTQRVRTACASSTEGRLDSPNRLSTPSSGERRRAQRVQRGSVPSDVGMELLGVARGTVLYGR